ncbi:MAG: hypothetical protein IPN82_05260 [Chitinophagaceae bacterium]|nr:hypothetical protein [Chitinophagaceae bacterium]
MKKFLLVALFALSFTSFGQMNDKQPLNPDSLMQKTNEQKDSISNKISTIKPTDNYDDIDRNMRYIQEIQKKNNAKKKRDAIVRIGIGIGLLVLLVIGLRRKRKTKAD